MRWNVCCKEKSWRYDHSALLGKSAKRRRQKFEAEILERRMMLSGFPTTGGPETYNRSAPMVVAPVGDANAGEIYVATAQPHTGGGTVFAVTLFSSDGTVDTTFGSDGTFYFNQFGTNTTDVPRAIALDYNNSGDYLAVAGSSGSGWGVAAIDVRDGGSLYWQDDGTHGPSQFESGSANAVAYELDHPLLYVAGNDADGNMAAAALTSSDGDPNTNFGDEGVETISITGDHTDSSTANAIYVEQPSEASNPLDQLFLGGTTQYTVLKSGSYVDAADFTIVALDDEYGTVDWTTRTNFACVTGSPCSANTPSQDAIYGLAQWTTATTI